MGWLTSRTTREPACEGWGWGWGRAFHARDQRVQRPPSAKHLRVLEGRVGKVASEAGTKVLGTGSRERGPGLGGRI